MPISQVPNLWFAVGTQVRQVSAVLRECTASNVRRDDSGEYRALIWVISGPTSAGKSTFMMNPRCAEITGLPPETPVAWPATYSNLDDGDAADSFYHYNILRPLHLEYRSGSTGTLRKQLDMSIATDFGRDPRWSDLTQYAAAKRAIVLVARKRMILHRIRHRQTIERQALTSQK